MPPSFERGIHQPQPERLTPDLLSAIQRRTDLTTGLTHESLEKLTLDSERPLIEQGGYGTDMYILLHGRVGVFKEGFEGTTQIAILDKPGDTIGEMALIYRREDGEPIRRTATVKALPEEDPPVVLVIPRSDFDEWNFAGGKLAKAHRIIMDTARKRFNTLMEESPEELRAAGYDWIPHQQQSIHVQEAVPSKQSEERSDTDELPPVAEHDIVDFTKERTERRKSKTPLTDRIKGAHNW